MDVIIRARARLIPGKAAGEDGITAEMLRALPITLVYVMLYLFQERMLGNWKESVREWTVIVLQFIRKVQSQSLTMAQHRVISLSCAINKWYMMCVIMIAETHPYPKIWNQVAVGGTAGLGPDLVIHTLKLVLEKSKEWPKDLPCVLVNADIEFAFDTLHPREVDLTLRGWGVHPAIAAAVLAEGNDLQGRACFEGIECIIPLNKCIRQGSFEAALLFGATVLRVIAPLVQIWKDDQWGVQFDHTRIPILVWADNFWLLGRSVTEAYNMTQQLSNVLGHAGFRFKPSSLQFLSASHPGHTLSFPPILPPSDLPPYLAALATSPPIPVVRVATMLILGSVLSAASNDTSSVAHRLDAMSRAFWSESEFLCSKSIPLHQRTTRFANRIATVGLHASGTWSWSKTLGQRLCAFELSLLRRVYRIPKLPQEGWVQYWRRSALYIRSDYIKKGNVPLFEQVLQRILALGTKIAPPESSGPPLKLNLAALIPWRSTTWWRTVQALTKDKGYSWRHATNYGPRGSVWDGVFVGVFGDAWEVTLGSIDHSNPKVRAEFVRKAMELVDLARPTRANQVNQAESEAPRVRPPKRPRTIGPRDDSIGTLGTPLTPSLTLIGDSQLVSTWINGQALVKGHHSGKVAETQCILFHLWRNHSLCVGSGQHWLRHVFREHNSEADLVADAASKTGLPSQTNHLSSVCTPIAYRLFVDGSGGKQNADYPSAGLYLQYVAVNDTQWNPLLSASIPLDRATTSTGAELAASNYGVKLIQFISNNRKIPDSILEWTRTLSPPPPKRLTLPNKFPKRMRLG